MSSQFLPIPGFTRYRINPETLELQSSANRHAGSKTVWESMTFNRHYQVRIYDNVGKRIVKSHLPRLLYSAIHGIDPTKIPSDVQIVLRDGMPAVTDISECREFAEKRKQIMQTLEAAKERYNESLLMSRLVLDAYESGDYSKVFMELCKQRNKFYSFAVKKKLAYSDESIEELWHYAIDVAMDCVRSFKGLVVNPGRFLCLVALNHHRERRKKERCKVRYNDCL